MMSGPRSSSRRGDGRLRAVNETDTALLVIDVQRGFDEEAYWGPRNNLECEANVKALIDAWRSSGEPLVFVRHDSSEDGSPLRAGQAGNDFKDVVTGEPDLLITKSVNSAFLGDPNLDEWLRARGVSRIAISGIQTNHCCETTARMGGNLGYEVLFVLDATHTFDRTGLQGEVFDADTLARVTAANLNEEFAEIVSARSLLDDRGFRA